MNEENWTIDWFMFNTSLDWHYGLVTFNFEKAVKEMLKILEESIHIYDENTHNVVSRKRATLMQCRLRNLSTDEIIPCELFV